MNNNLIGFVFVLLLTPNLAAAAVVPEPSTLALFGLAIAGIFASRIRKK
jgi:hypothetical protein|tara:strand:+ start:44 stop:190 length:147 start_codon:yes stop_codon:yes gene_type:complete